MFKNISISNRAKGLYTHFRYSKRYSIHSHFLSRISLPNPHVKIQTQYILFVLVARTRSTAQQPISQMLWIVQSHEKRTHQKSRIMSFDGFPLHFFVKRLRLFRVRFISVAPISVRHFQIGLFLLLLFLMVENSFVWMLLHAVNLGLESCPLHWC